MKFQSRETRLRIRDIETPVLEICPMTGSCKQCRDGVALDFDFTMAFQPIVDLRRKAIWGYEALVRGVDGAGAGQILSNVTPENRYRFDQACRVKAIELAARLFPADDTRLSINFMPNAVYDPAACIRTTLAAAGRTGFSLDRLMFEFTENEPILDTAHIKRIIAEYRRRGFITAIDDFGAGYAGLKLLANFQPDLVKIDMDLVRDIDTSPARQAIVAGIIAICRQLDVMVLAEGVETEAELAVLRAAGVSLVPGYYLARPTLAALPAVELLARAQVA
jgi:EAL domain-containing protein (putative c-di-GMP-specific phosphodiesterase class I)